MKTMLAAILLLAISCTKETVQESDTVYMLKEEFIVYLNGEKYLIQPICNDDNYVKFNSSTLFDYMLLPVSSAEG